MNGANLNLDGVPPEILLEVLKRLPVRSLCRFKCVSKEWFSSISGQLFMDSHFDHSKSNPKLLICCRRPGSLSFLSMHCSPDLDDNGQTVTCDFSCANRRNFHVSQSLLGFICIDTFKEIIVYNPATRESINLDTFWKEGSRSVLPTDRSVFFGFDPVGKKHKVLMSWMELEPRCIMVNYVITLGEKKWRRINDSPPRQELSDGAWCIDGVLYNVYLTSDYKNRFLMAFDVRLESIEQIKLPYDMKFTDSDVWVAESEGHVTLLGWGNWTFLYPDAPIAMWVLEDVQKRVWSRKRLLHAVPNLGIGKWLYVAGTTHKGEVLLAKHAANSIQKPFHLYHCNLKDDVARTTEIHGLHEYLGVAFPEPLALVRDYVESLQSLK